MISLQMTPEKYRIPRHAHNDSRSGGEKGDPLTEKGGGLPGGYQKKLGRLHKNGTLKMGCSGKTLKAKSPCLICRKNTHDRGKIWLEKASATVMSSCQKHAVAKMPCWIKKAPAFVETAVKTPQEKRSIYISWT